MIRKGNVDINWLILIGLIFVVGCGQQNSPKEINNEKILLKGTIKGYYNNKVLIQYNLGGELMLFDSIQTNGKGTFTYEFPKSSRQGIWHATWGNNSDKKVRFIVDNENITFQAIDHYNPEVSFISSPKNSAFQKYAYEKDIFFERLRALGPVLTKYSSEDDFYKSVKKEFVKIQVDYYDMIDKLVGQDTVSFLYQYLKSDKLPKLNPILTLKEQNNWFYQHWFDHVDFSNPILINSNLFGEKILYHLSLGQAIAILPEYQTEMFKSSVDEILLKSSINNEVYSYCVSKLLSIFREIGNEDIIGFILESHRQNMECSDLSISYSLNDEIAALKKIQLGSIAPDIYGETIKGDTLSLYELSSDYVLLVFWSANCPGCIELLPKLNQLSSIQDDLLDIYSFSVDTIDMDWEKFIIQNKINFHVLTNNNKLTKKALSDYVITSTPTMFLLDEDRRIIYKPINYFDLMKKINELGVI